MASRMVDHVFFDKVGMDCFRKLKIIGWGVFFSLKENIYLELIKEFCANLAFDSTKLRATSMMKRWQIELNQEFFADVIGCLNEGIERYFSHEEVPYKGYSREKAIK